MYKISIFLQVNQRAQFNGAANCIQKVESKTVLGFGVIIPVGAVFNSIFLSSPSDLRQNMADVRRE